MSGFIHLYYGDGKGKTTAALGLSIRCAGAGKKVLLTRFMKADSSNELNSLTLLPSIDYISNNEVFGYYYRMTEKEKKDAYKYYNALLKKACKKAIDENYDLLILDEITYVYSYPLIDADYLLKFLQNVPDHLDVVLTGKHPAQELIDIADYITEVKKIRHPYDKGVLPREGIDY